MADHHHHRGGGGGGGGHSAPIKYHSERGHSHNASTTSTSSSSSSSSSHLAPPAGVPAASPSPPPTPHCPHVTSLLSLEQIRQRFRSRTFQRAYTGDALECVDCQCHFPKEHLWACLQCTNLDCARCGRHHQKHALSHSRATGHALAIHLSTRVIWCYTCDAEVPDEYETKRQQTTQGAAQQQQQQQQAITPQLVRSALDREDVATEAEDLGADEAEEDDDAPVTYKDFLNNPQGGMTGLSNLGNTCFFNAGMQALLHCPPLIAFFSQLHGNPDSRRLHAMHDAHTAQQQRNQELRLQLVDHFSVLLQKTWGGRYHLCVPTDLLRDILLLNPFFKGYAQHDSQEFIRCILDNLHEATKTKVQYEYDLKRQQAAASSTDDAQEHADKEEAEQQSDKDDSTPKSAAGNAAAAAKRYPETSIIADLFQGTLESSVRCTNCGHVSLTRDPFYDLSLEIPKEQQLKKIGAERGSAALTPQTSRGFFGGLGTLLGLSTPTLSLETCLHSFCTSDQLQKVDQYKCDKCKCKVDAVKMLSLGTERTLPEVLCIHIKRFSHNSHWGSKISRHVTFPLVDLDMAPFLTKQTHNKQTARAQAQAQAQTRKPSGNNNQNKSNGPAPFSSSSSSSSASSSPPSSLYDLFAIVRHLGSVSGGHYIAYCKSHVTGRWFEFDDKIVTEVSEEKVSRIEAYVLFYRRKHPLAPLQRILRQVEAVVQANPSHASSKPIRYISRHWLKKMEVLGRPEPIDNRDLCCPHGMPKPLPRDGGDVAVAISAAGWESLFGEYGGGPIVDTAEGASCEPCDLPLIRKQERARIASVDALASKQAADDPFLLIHSGWLQQWRAFVSSNGPRPGAISNHLLFESDGETLLPDLRRGEHYRALHGMVWQELWDIYGGGPVIERPSVDIYQLTQAQPQPPTVHMDEGTDGEEEEEAEEEETEEEQQQQPQPQQHQQHQHHPHSHHSHPPSQRPLDAQSRS